MDIGMTPEIVSLILLYNRNNLYYLWMRIAAGKNACKKAMNELTNMRLASGS
jgi:hypothetical protein